MRLFIGIRLPADIRERLGSIWNSFSDRPSDIREIEQDSWHVTLAFLGDVEEEKRPALERLITGALERPPHGSFSLISLETFPPKGPTTVVAKLDADEAAPWKPFVEQLRDMVSVAAPHVDRKPWMPHATLARSRKGNILPTWSQSIERISWQPTELALILSEPAPNGSRYSDLHVFPLDI
jgi:2'-5' RNA ligase